MAGCDAVIHVAGSLRGRDPGVGERPAMYEANVGRHRARPRRGDRRAASRAHRRTSRPSTCSAIRTARSLDETLPSRPCRRVHELLRRDQVPRPRGRRGSDRGRRADRHRDARDGLWARTTIPASGAQLKARLRRDGCGSSRFGGRRASRRSHVDDLAAGIVAALDRGRIGESYVLGGENMRHARGDGASAPGPPAAGRRG